MGVSRVSKRHSTELKMRADESKMQRMERRKKVVDLTSFFEERITMNDAALPENDG